MQESPAQCYGVLSPKQENNVKAPKTPVTNRTRSTIRKKPDSEYDENVHNPSSESTQLLIQTPRRSARKSVRPPMDYYDIIENSTRSISKKNMEIPSDDNESQVDKPSKSDKNGVGRQKLKSKRKSKKSKTRYEKNAGEVMEEKHKESQVESIPEETQESVPVSESVTASPKPEPEQLEEKTVIEESSVDSEPVLCLVVSPQSITVSEDELELSPPKNDNENKLISLKIDDDDLDDLGLKPLNKDDDIDMPSLIVVDDEMEDVLNRTFDASEAVQPENSSTINAVEQPQKPKPEFESSKNHEAVADIKIILTNVQDQNTTILSPSNNTILAGSKPKAFKFPTPFKANAKPSLTFSMGNTSSRKTQLALYNKELEDSCSIRRRSKSFTDFNETRNRTVTFFSPVEVAPIEDIDKRWERLDVSNVTQRRRRSKSLDSRIPKPKFVSITKTNTPGKLKPRKKVPNFAAIHQKQFDNMENLEEHIERKKARAKELTSSALKQPPRVESVQKKIPAVGNILGADRARPGAVKKIDISADTSRKGIVPLTPMKVDTIPRQKNLSSLKKHVETKMKSRLPIATAVKVFTSTSAPPDQLPFIEDKAEARRQRHMNMFKGRTIKEKKTDFIRGVRSNRRFELQMKHRQQLEEKKI